VRGFQLELRVFL